LFDDLKGDYMGDKLFLEKLSDEKLKELLELLEDMEIKGTTDSEIIHHYADTWYDNRVGVERLLRLQIDTYREASHRYRSMLM
jgi:tRNA U54 and U55 pseudouridine synthase Pus10